MKNFFRANYKLINSQLDIDWDIMMEGSVDDSFEYFYVINEVIEKNFPNIISSPSQYPNNLWN